MHGCSFEASEQAALLFDFILYESLAEFTAKLKVFHLDAFPFGTPVFRLSSRDAYMLRMVLAISAADHACSVAQVEMMTILMLFTVQAAVPMGKWAVGQSVGLAWRLAAGGRSRKKKSPSSE